jgi:hypothetical protein
VSAGAEALADDVEERAQHGSFLLIVARCLASFAQPFPDIRRQRHCYYK